MKDLKKEIEERIILLMARERLTANDVIKNLMPMIETLLLSERKKILEEVREELESLQTEEFEGEEEDYFIRKTEVEDIIDFKVSKITKRGR